MEGQRLKQCDMITAKLLLQVPLQQTPSRVSQRMWVMYVRIYVSPWV